MPHEPPRCGRIAYTNDLPVYTALDQGVVTFPGGMVADVPARLNQALLEGHLDISPISSAFYALHSDELALMSGVCIGAQDKVHSICCISHEAPAALAARTVAVTRESVTGRMLFRLICRKQFGFDPVMVESDDPFAAHVADGSPCVLIGDKAIDAAEQAPAGSVYDLGELWYRLVGAGMVYAVWAVRKEYAQRSPVEVRSVSHALRESLEWGLANIDRVVERAQASQPRAAGFYEQYYRALRFRFDAEMRAAFEGFCSVAHDAGILELVPTLQFFDEVPQHV